MRIRLKKPISYFIQIFTFWVTFPLRQDQVERLGSKWAQPGKAVVLGPFVPTDYKFGSQLTLKRNALYYGKKPELDEVVFKIVTDDSTALNLFKSGKLDFTRPINVLELKNLETSLALHKNPYFRTCFIGFNLDKTPLQNADVRKAIAMAIDKKAF